MGIVYIILIVIAFVLLLLFAFDAKVKLVFDTDRNDMHLSVNWIYPFIKGTVSIENWHPAIDVYIFRVHLFKKTVKAGSQGILSRGKKSGKGIRKTDLLKIFNLKELSINTKYGFTNPSATGIACGAFNTASQFINIDSLSQIPDFMSAHDYIYFDAEASVNLGASLTNLIKYYRNRRNLQWIKTQA
ncbi:hypothetical protein [Ruminiclostridium cellobioparum]|jgi:hypothetical protein|uniref:hypothetical protein n=1 Tax=Ruminiclostridium cellobioparum TaxID=29355 RepID=UPI0028AAB1FE|nr:hypothetical protein [Ruminiclostridium cellobioparum]